MISHFPTASAYLRVLSAFSGGNCPGAYLRVTKPDGTVLAESERLTKYDADYVRLIAPFTLGTAQSVRVHILADGAGTVYADAAQLENNPFANAYNLVTNGGFERGETGWDATGGVNVVTGTAEQARRWDPAQCVTEGRTAAETAAYFGRDLRQALADFWKKQAYPGSYTLCTVTPVENDAYSLVRRREDGQIVDDTATYTAEMMQLYEGAAFSERFTVSVTASRIAPPAAFADRRLLSNTDEVNQFKASDGETYDVKVYEVGKDKVVADFAVHGIYYRVTAEGEVNHAALRCFIELGIAG